MNDEMILVPRAELLAWAKAWLNEYDPNDGTDCVTPFDTYLLKSPESEDTATKALEYVFGLYTDWGRVVEEKMTPPWPLEHHARAMGLFKDKPPAESQPVVSYARAFELIGDAYIAGTHGIGYSQQAMELSEARTAPSAPVGVEGLAADLETIWHSVSDDKETNAAYQRLKSALAQQPAAEAQPCGCGEAACTAPWEPGCGLGKSEQHAEALQAENEALRDGLDYLRQMQGVPDVLELRAEAAQAEAEIERLRAEREVIGAEAVKYAERSGRLQAKVYLLAEMLKKLAAFVRPTCPSLWDKAQAVLREHGGNAE